MYFLTYSFLCRLKALQSREKTRKLGKRLGRSPVIQLNYPSPLFHLIGLWQWFFQVKNKSRGHLHWAENSFVPVWQWKPTLDCRCLPSSGSLPTRQHEQRCRAQQWRGEAGTLTAQSEAQRWAAGADLAPGDRDLGLAKRGINYLRSCARLTPSLCKEIHVSEWNKASSFLPWVLPSRWSYVPYSKCWYSPERLSNYRNNTYWML